MRITRLYLQDVKRHERLELELHPGLNVIRGPNEAGKSTVQRALEMALFRRANSTAQGLDGIRRWGADGDPRVELAFEDETLAGRRVSGQLSKVFAGAKGQVELVLDGERIVDAGVVERTLAELTGLPSEKFFRSTASVRHQELADLDRDEGAVRDRLQQSMSGADRGTWAAKRKLEDKVRQYRSEGAKNPGEPKRLRDEIARLEARLRHGEAELTRLELDRQRLSDARDERQRLEARLEVERERLEASERAVTARTRLDDVEEQYGRYRRAAEIREQIAWKASTPPWDGPLDVLRSAVGRLRSAEYDLSELRADLATEAALPAVDAPVDEPATRPWALLALLLAGAAIVVGVLGLAAGAGPAATGLAVVLAVVALVALLWVFRVRRKAGEARLRNALRDAEIERRRAGRAHLMDRLASAEEARAAALRDAGTDDLAAAEQLLAAHTEHAASIGRLEAEFRGLLGDVSDEVDVVKRRDALAAEAERLRHALAGMGDIANDPGASRVRYLNIVAAAQSQREQAVRDEALAAARVDHDPVDAEEVARLAEEMEERRAEFAAVERRLRVYELTLSALNAAEQATMKKAARYLEQGMARDVAHITDGRYRRVQVDETELSFRVWSPERGDWVDVTSLSQGTVDQFYLAARLGLVRQVTQHRRPPLVFDDPFVTFDDDRARRSVALLKRLARDHQVLYLTASDRYDELADAVFALPGPSVVDAAVERPAEPQQPRTRARVARPELPPGDGRSGADTPVQTTLSLEAHESASTETA